MGIRHSLFNDPKFREQVATKLGCKSSQIKDLVLPMVGENLVWRGLVWKVTYVRDNPLRFQAEPLRVYVPEENKEDKKTLWERLTKIFRFQSPRKISRKGM